MRTTITQARAEERKQRRYARETAKYERQSALNTPDGYSAIAHLRNRTYTIAQIANLAGLSEEAVSFRARIGHAINQAVMDEYIMCGGYDRNRMP